MQIPHKRVNRHRAGRKFGEEWYTCEKCGFDYPRHSVIVQGGLITCTGPSTTGCYDAQGAAVFRKQVEMPLEKPNPPLPVSTEDMS
jgi:hypothetical protein